MNYYEEGIKGDKMAKGILTGKSVIGNTLEDEKDFTLTQHLMQLIGGLFQGEAGDAAATTTTTTPTTTTSLPPTTTTTQPPAGGIITGAETRVEEAQEAETDRIRLLDEAFGGF